MEELDLGQTIRGFRVGQKVFRRYTLVRIIGRGGMGVVWLARDEELERDVALKFLPDLVVHDLAVLDELKRETRRSLQLTHHNIVRIHDFVQDTESACISMEYVNGPPPSRLCGWSNPTEFLNPTCSCRGSNKYAVRSNTRTTTRRSCIATSSRPI